MPVDLGLKTLLKTALSDGLLTPEESTSIATLAESAEGPATENVHEIVGALAAALADGALDLTTADRRKTVDALLGKLNALAPLPLDAAAAAQPDGTVSWVAALGLGQAGDAALGKLPHKSFDGKTVRVLGETIRIGGETFAPSIAGAKPAQVDALFALLRPGQLDGLDAARKAAVAGALVDALTSGLPIALEASGKYEQVAACLAATGALSTLAPSLSSGQVDALLTAYDKLPSPMAQAALHRALSTAPKTEAQSAALAAKAAPKAKDHLLGVLDGLAAGTYEVGWNALSGPATALALSGVAFARDEAATKSFFDGMKIYAGLNPSGEEYWDAEECRAMGSILKTYVETHPQTSFLYGTFASGAKRELAKLTNAKLTAELGPVLAGPSPSIGGVPLTKPQAELVQSLLPGLADPAAADAVGRALAEAAATFSTGPSFGGAPTPTTPLGPAAFALFARRAAAALEGRDGTENGMIDARALLTGLRDEVAGIKKVLGPELAALGGTPPKFGGVEVGADGAAYLRQLLADRLRSEMSVTNLAQAVKVVADAHGGELSAPALAKLKTIVADYEQNWPEAKTFDFNKLGRMASFAVKGQTLPLCTLDGEPVGLAKFVRSVGAKVADAIDGASHAWMGARWGLRAMESVELLDVIAQSTAEGKGPIRELMKKHPGKAITVEATGCPGAHEQFVFVVDGVGRFTMGSDGKLTKRSGSGKSEPVLFTATIREDGAFDVKVKTPVKTSRWPIQTPYSVGDSIDLRFFDKKSKEKAKEGQPFETQSRVVEARIESYDGAGKYTVTYEGADGKRVPKTISIDEIETYNNPHHFPIQRSSFSDVSIAVKKQPALEKFLEGARAIAKQHLPSGAAMLELSPAELAKAQLAAVKALMAYTRQAMSYPVAKDANPDPASKSYHEIIDALDSWETTPLAKLIELKKGVCRHQCILQQLVLQEAGIDSRLASGAANTASGDFRGYHIWVEIQLADGRRYLSDQTWNDPAIGLWDGAYDRDRRRIEMYARTSRYDEYLVS